MLCATVGFHIYPDEMYINTKSILDYMFKKRGESKEYRGFFARHKLAVAVATLMGTIIGAGVLGIPYLVAKTGFVYGFLLIVLIGVASMFINLFIGEVVLRTRQQHQLSGYAEKYLGKTGKNIFGVTMLFGIYGALIAYLIGEGAAMYSIFKWGSPLFFTLLFFLVAFVIVYKGVKAAGSAELILISLLFLMVILIGVFSFRQINVNFLTTHIFTNIFLPYGVILFAFIGFASVPELQEELGNEKKKMKSAIVIGSIIPIILYLIFTVIVVGIVGLNNFELLGPNEKIATIALSIYSQPLLGMFANILAILSMFTSFLALSIAMLETYEYDYHVSIRTSLCLAYILPLVVVLFNLTSFISILGFVGAITGGINGIIIVLMYWKAKKSRERVPEYSMGKHVVLGWALIVMFALGVLLELWNIFL